ncbi:outer dense fiber protein 2-like isoform X2 [Cheilinus undulatus]|uniref:outer dense fiber protein 2-like isoform X2 n=1 Tax=Cheilinus undulatus TaxID=241271 RepID=UPI001BD56A40|nr:outer dense fiber protein 2-like isoform X2 [Cheilinus undulatus]
MSPEDDLQGPPLGFSSTREDGTLGCDTSQEPRGANNAHNSLQTRTAEADIIRCGDLAVDGKGHFLKILMDAETAANSAALQLVSFKDAMEDEFADSRHSAIDKRRIARQKRLLLEKLDDFRRINKSVRQKLKQLQDAEAQRVNADRQIDILLKKISQAESENNHLKRDLSETEKRVEDLMNQRREEQANMKSAVHMTKSVEATRAHLQGQLRNKEAENNRLTVQLRTLERTLTQQKMELDELKSSITPMTEKAAQDKESLKKATRAQKLRAERFEAAIEKCYEQLKEKDVQLANARSERDSRRKQKEQLTDENAKLSAHIELLKSQTAELTARLQKEKDELHAANEVVMQRIEKLSAENGDLSFNNASLKASVAQLEQQLAEAESALIEEKIVSQEMKHQTEKHQFQAAELQAEVDDLRTKYANLLRETERRRDGKDAEVDKVRRELQGRVDELKPFPELLNSAEKSLFECQENLRRSERRCSEKSESVRQLQAKMESQTELLSSSVEMKESVREANLQLQERVITVQKQIEKLQQENLELVRRLAAQEEALSYSNRQLDQRSSECQALSRQLETALSDVRQQINKVKDKAVSREEVLQTRIVELEAEKSRRDNELRLLRQKKISAEKQFETRLKDLQLSLDQSESHKQSIQNYVDFLKNSYTSMFDEGLQTTTFGSSYFLK